MTNRITHTHILEGGKQGNSPMLSLPFSFRFGRGKA